MTMRELVTIGALLAACESGLTVGNGGDDLPPLSPDGGGSGSNAPVAPELGTGDHTPGSVDLVVVAQAPALNRPMDLAFDPATGHLWIVNQGDDSWTIVTAGTPRRYYDDSNHFLRAPASLSFIHGEQALATCQESINGGDGFMGPTAWTSDLTKFDGGHASHYDMLHESSYCMGIAWQTARVFWLFNGERGVIDRVDYRGWHPDVPGGLGGMNHSDGRYYRYPDAHVKRVAGIPSGMQFDAGDRMLYVADTGNGRLARMPTDGAIGPQISSRFGEVPMFRAAGTLADVVPSGKLVQPSGLTIENDLLYVGDRETGMLHAFDKSGQERNWLDTGLGAGHVGSLAIGPDGKLYFLDTPGNQLYRVDPK
jgi:hypothetical protein